MAAAKDLPLIVNELLDVLHAEEVNTIPEILEVYGMLGYMLGLSIEGFSPEEEISTEILKERYIKDESVGAALMLQSQMIRSWVTAWEIQQKNRKKRKDETNASK